jgi:hypothetical protein
VLARGLDEYGILPFAALVAVVPPEARSVGIVTMPFDKLCSAQKTCPCECHKIVQRLKSQLEDAPHLLQPHTVTIRDNDDELGAWARLTFSPLGTVCSPSTFCLWPALASRRGLYAKSSLFPAAEKVAEFLEGFHVIQHPKALTYKELRGPQGGGRLQCTASIGARTTNMLTREKASPPVICAHEKKEKNRGEGQRVKLESGAMGAMTAAYCAHRKSAGQMGSGGGGGGGGGGPTSAAPPMQQPPQLHQQQKAGANGAAISPHLKRMHSWLDELKARTHQGDAPTATT